MNNNILPPLAADDLADRRRRHAPAIASRAAHALPVAANRRRATRASTAPAVASLAAALLTVAALAATLAARLP